MLSDDFGVEYYQFTGDEHVIRFEQWSETAIVEVVADGPGDPFEVDYLGLVELNISDDDRSRLRIDVVNNDGEIMRYYMDLCPPPARQCRPLRVSRE